MKKKLYIIFLTIILVGAAMGKSKVRELGVKKLSENVLVISGNYFEEHMTAVATGAGLVIIDTLTTAADTRRAYEAIKEFSSEPVRYVINTHFDLDHYAGNQVFANAAIIGHHNCKSHFDEVMFADPKNIDEVKTLIKQVEEQYRQKKPGSQEAEIWKRYVDEYRVLLEGFDGFTFTPPTLYIPGDIKLELGDTVIEVKYFGPGHTNADLVVIIPGEKLMITGDLILGKGFIPVIHDKHGGSVGNLIHILRELAKMEGEIDTIVPGHGQVTDLSAAKAQLEYLESVQKAVTAARQKNLTLKEAQEKIKMEKYKYYWLYDFVHSQNIEIAWNEQKNSN